MAELPARQKVVALMAEYRERHKALVDLEAQLLQAADETTQDIVIAMRRESRLRGKAARLLRSMLLVATGIVIGLAAAGVGRRGWQWLPTLAPPKVTSDLPAAAPVGATADPAPVPELETPPVVVTPSVAGPVKTVSARVPTPAPAPPATPVTPPAAKAMPLREELLNASQRWLDAYYRQDKATMATITIAEAAIEDERTDAERLPPGLSNVQRTLTAVNFHQTDTVAMITANMVERSGDARGAESYISHLWVRQNGMWQLQTVRLTAAPALAPSVQ